MMDANRNQSAVAFDALGMVVGTAVMGKPGQHAGDTLDGFDADLHQDTILEHLAHPLGDPHAILQQATTRLVYDLFAYDRTRDDKQPQPTAVYTLARETHVADLQPGQHSKVQHMFSYSDGFGRQIQKKIQAEAGPIGDDGPDVNPRWVASGWTIFNNKGKPVRQYEPFFSASHDFQFANKQGVSSILFYDPLERVVATLHPNHTYEKVVVDPWRQATWDLNDTVLEKNPADDPDVGDFFVNLPAADYLPTWYEQRIEGQLGKESEQAAQKASVHARTPSVAYLDTLGRTFLTVAHNRFARAGVPVDEFLATRNELDIVGNQRAVIDALGRVVVRYDYDMRNTRLRQVSVDSGTRWMLNDATAKLMLAWDSRGHRLRHEYDALHRPTNLHVRNGSEPEFLAERVVYGEGQPHDQALNLRGKMFRQFDAAGIVSNGRYDFKGNLLESTRQLLEDYKNDVNWSGSPELLAAVFTTARTFDALNRTITLTTPDASVARSQYNQANLLESLSVNLHGAVEPTPFVTYVNYNAKGQRTIIEYGNGARTRYTYDPLTFRLTRLETIRQEDHARLQDLHYAFDPSGNITSIHDDAQETVYFRNHVVSSSNAFIYDAIYRLISADGREHAGRPSRPTTTDGDSWRVREPIPSDGHAMSRYREQYQYDAVGNILELVHSAPGGNWSRSYSYDEPHARPGNNRLTSTEVGQNKEHYAYDADGNMTRMTHLPRIEWDFKDQLHATRRQEHHTGPGETTYYIYDSAGQRVRKVTERASGSRKHERIYLGGFELYRELDSVGTTILERDTLHIMDDRHRIALVETRTMGDDPAPRELTRYQFANHLDSVALELDHHAMIISYQEYTPYGCTSYQAVRHQTETPARYRYTGRERDDESAFYYCLARYYCPWLCRWLSPDPKGIAGGINLYGYASDSPIVLRDPNGRDPQEPEKKDNPPAVKGDKKETLQHQLDQTKEPEPKKEKKKPQPPVQNSGPTQTAGLPNDVPVGKITTELNAGALVQTPQDPKVGPTVQITAIQAHVRVRTSPTTEQGVLVNVGGVAPTGGSSVAQAHPGSSYNTGAIQYTVHTGDPVDPNDEKRQASSGNFYTAGVQFNNPGPDTKVNLLASYVHARSYTWGGGDKGVDFNVGSAVQPVGQLYNRSVGLLASPTAAANVYFPGPGDTQVNIEGYAGANIGVAGPTGTRESGDPSVPVSLRLGGGVGIQAQVGEKKDYTVGFEVLVNAEPKANIEGPPGTPSPISVGAVFSVAAY